MRGKVHAHVLLLLLQQREDILVAGEGRNFWPHGFELLHLAEERVGGVELVVAVEARVFDDFVDAELPVLAGQEELRTLIAEGVQRTGIDQRLKGAAVQHLGHPLHEIEEVREGTVLAALADNGLHDVLAKAFQTAQAVADISALVDGERRLGLVYIWAEHLDAGLAAVRHDLLHLVHVRDVLREVGGLEFRRIMRLDPGGLVAYPGVAGGVRLVESVFRESLPV